MQRNWVTHALLVGMSAGGATLENSLTDSQKAKHATVIHAGNCTLGMYPMTATLKYKCTDCWYPQQQHGSAGNYSE